MWLFNSTQRRYTFSRCKPLYSDTLHDYTYHESLWFLSGSLTSSLALWTKPIKAEQTFLFSLSQVSTSTSLATKQETVMAATNHYTTRYDTRAQYTYTIQYTRHASPDQTATSRGKELHRTNLTNKPYKSSKWSQSRWTVSLTCSLLTTTYFWNISFRFRNSTLRVLFPLPLFLQAFSFSGM